MLKTLQSRLLRDDCSSDFFGIISGKAISKADDIEKAPKESLAKSVSKCFPSELSEWPLEFLAAGQEGTREKSMVVTSIRLLFSFK